jgi:TolB-like protein
MSALSRRSTPTSAPPIPPEGIAAPSGSVAVPYDVKKAVDFIRARTGEKVTIADLVEVCGVAERTLRKHFCVFLGLAPREYLRRTRLAAVREQLLSAVADVSVTEIAARNGFSHFGRFAAQYRRCFGETPSSTLRRACSPESNSAPSLNKPPPLVRNSRERPSLVILPLRTATIDHIFFAESLAEGLACALSSARSLSVTLARSPNVASLNLQRLARENSARYCLTGRVSQAGERLRVIICLLDAANERHLWGDSFDGRTNDLFELQDRVTEGVVLAILPNVRKPRSSAPRESGPRI